jgi:ATP-binding cassette subfamily B protein
VRGQVSAWKDEVLRTADQRRRLARLLLRGPRLLVAASVAVAAVSGLLPVAFVLAGGALSRAIQDAVRAPGDPSLVPVYRAFLIVVGLFLASQLLGPLQERLRWLLRRRLDEHVRARIMTACLAGTDMRRLHDETFLEALRWVRGLVYYSITPGGGAVGLIGVSREYLTAVSAALVVGWFQPLLAVYALAVATVLRMHWRRADIRIIDHWRMGLPKIGEARYFVELGLGREAASEVRLFGLGGWLTDRIHAAGMEGWRGVWSSRTQTLRRQTLLHLLLGGSAAAVALIWAARATGRGSLTVPELVVFVPALFTLLGAGRAYPEDSTVEYGGRTVPAVETMERFARETVESETGRLAPPDRPPAVELRGVWFRYPGSEHDVLRGVDLTIPAGGSAALVGMNGAGKTTLMRLICGLYHPQQGSILVDGVDLRELDIDAWHRRVAPMFQEFMRVQASVAENVAVGSVANAGDRDGITQAAEQAGVAVFAGRLAQGLDTPLSVSYAEGTDLSGGQWQRLGLARSLFSLAHGARLLILDEPTSNLDTSSEERLISRLVDETRGAATTLLVTHRLALARRTDVVYVLEGGAVVERGTHAELLRAGGRYSHAFGMQASLYPLDGDADA